MKQFTCFCTWVLNENKNRFDNYNYTAIYDYSEITKRTALQLGHCSFKTKRREVKTPVTHDGGKRRKQNPHYQSKCSNQPLHKLFFLSFSSQDSTDPGLSWKKTTRKQTRGSGFDVASSTETRIVPAGIPEISGSLWTTFTWLGLRLWTWVWRSSKRRVWRCQGVFRAEFWGEGNNRLVV